MQHLSNDCTSLVTLSTNISKADVCAVFPVLEESEKANGDACDSEVISAYSLLKHTQKSII